MRNGLTIGVVIFSMTLAVGCKPKATNDVAPADAAYGSDAPPATTTRPNAVPATQPARSGDAVPKPDARAGEVIIGGSGPGSPGTR